MKKNGTSSPVYTTRQEQRRMPLRICKINGQTPVNSSKQKEHVLSHCSFCDSMALIIRGQPNLCVLCVYDLNGHRKNWAGNVLHLWFAHFKISALSLLTTVCSIWWQHLEMCSDLMCEVVIKTFTFGTTKGSTKKGVLLLVVIVWSVCLKVGACACVCVYVCVCHCAHVPFTEWDMLNVLRQKHVTKLQAFQ